MPNSTPEQGAPTHCLSCTRARDRDARHIGHAPFYRSEKYRFLMSHSTPVQREPPLHAARTLSPSTQERGRGCEGVTSLCTLSFFLISVSLLGVATLQTQPIVSKYRWTIIIFHGFCSVFQSWNIWFSARADIELGGGGGEEEA